MQSDGNFSKYLLSTAFATNKDVVVIRPKRTPLNVLKGIWNGFQQARDLFSPSLFSNRRYLRQSVTPVLPNFEKIADQLSPLGHELAANMRNHRVIDLGSGDPDVSYIPRVLAQTWGAEEYVGVDANIKKSMTRKNEFRGSSRSFRSTFVKSDMLAYLKNLEKTRPANDSPILFFIEGIEWDQAASPNPDATFAYMKDLMETLQRISRPGDGIFIGMTVSFLHPPEDYDRFAHLDIKYDRKLTINPAEYGFVRTQQKTLNTYTNDSESTANGAHDIWVKK
jgi:hypothetical protein